MVYLETRKLQSKDCETHEATTVEIKLPSSAKFHSPRGSKFFLPVHTVCSANPQQTQSKTSVSGVGKRTDTIFIFQVSCEHFSFPFITLVYPTIEA